MCWYGLVNTDEAVYFDKLNLGLSNRHKIDHFVQVFPHDFSEVALFQLFLCFVFSLGPVPTVPTLHMVFKCGWCDPLYIVRDFTSESEPCYCIWCMDSFQVVSFFFEFWYTIDCTLSDLSNSAPISLSFSFQIALLSHFFFTNGYAFC